MPPAFSRVPAITGSKLADLVTCERRFANDMLADVSLRDHVNGFVEMLWKEGNRHEGAVIAGMNYGLTDLRGMAMADGTEATLAALKDGASLIVGARFELDDRVGMPDVLMRVEDSVFAGDIKAGSPFTSNGVDLKPTYAAQIGFYSRLLEDGGWGDGGRAFVIGADGKAAWFDIRAPRSGGRPSIADEVERLTHKARDIRDGIVATSAAACAMCGLCVWKSACKAELADADDLTLISGVGRSARGNLAGTATTIAGLAALPIGRGAPKVSGIGAARLDTFVERARSLATPGSTAYATRPLGLAPRAREIHLDLETDPTGGNLVYLHGARERVRQGDRTEERYVHFLALDTSEERDAFAGAMEYLTADPDSLITTYSQFERTTYRMLQRRYPEVATVEQVEALFSTQRCIDLYFGAVLPSTVWPTHSLGLKSIARFLGFDWRDTDASGANSIGWFVEYVETRDAALLQRILDYNADDCAASLVVFDGLMDLPVRGPLPWPPEPAGH